MIIIKKNSQDSKYKDKIMGDMASQEGKTRGLK
jgi:hypothetical protein